MAILGHFGLLVCTWALVEVFARAGAGVTVFLDRKTRPALETLGVGFLLGISALGTALVGLALAGLLRPVPIWAVPVFMLAMSRGSYPSRSRAPGTSRATPKGGARPASWKPKSVVVPALRGIGWPGWPLAILAAAGGVAVLYSLLLPELGQDSYVYHLGAPWQFLMAGRMIFSWVPTQFHLSLPVEMSYVYPLLLGEERMTKCMVACSFLAANFVWYSRFRAGTREWAAWLGPLFALASTATFQLACDAKDDAVGGAFFVAGALLFLQGSRTVGLALLGTCVAAKYANGPLVAAFVLAVAWPFRRPVRLALLAIPALPWLFKSYLAMGDPVYPFGYKWFSEPAWGATNQQAALAYSVPFWFAGTEKLSGIPMAWVRCLWLDHPLFLVLLPLALVRGRRHRSVAWACVIAQLVTLAASHTPRYLLPSVWLLSLMVVLEASTWTVRKLDLAPVVLGGYVVFRVFNVMAGAEARLYWRDILAPPGRAISGHLSTYGDAIGMVSEARASRVLTIAELRTYRIPARVLYGGMMGETPLIWKLARESRDSGHLQRKFRQLGVQVLLYNFVGEWWAAQRNSFFVWGSREVSLYKEFFKRHFTVSGRTRCCDYRGGGFYVFDYRPRPPARPAETIWFLPGTEGIYAKGLALEAAGRQQDAFNEYKSILAWQTDVGHAWNVVGHVWPAGNRDEAMRHLGFFAEQGMVDMLNLLDCGRFLIDLGELDRAESVLRKALVVYLSEQNSVRANLASLCTERAARMIPRGDLDAAEKAIAQADEWMSGIPSADRTGSTRSIAAQILGFKGEVRFRRGELNEAVALFNRAAEMDPAGNVGEFWRKRLAAVTKDSQKLFPQGR